MLVCLTIWIDVILQKQFVLLSSPCDRHCTSAYSRACLKYSQSPCGILSVFWLMLSLQSCNFIVRLADAPCLRIHTACNSAAECQQHSMLQQLTNGKAPLVSC